MVAGRDENSPALVLALQVQIRDTSHLNQMAQLQLYTWGWNQQERGIVTCRWHGRLDVSGVWSVANLSETSVLSTDPEPLLT
jgi:hypothetical protein